MDLSLILNEEDLRVMPPALREGLFRWYFARQSGASAKVQKASATIEMAGDMNTEQSGEPYPSPDNGSRRVTFAELVRGGFLKRGAEIWCRSLKRQQRAGAEDYIKGAKIADTGAVVYQGRQYSNPSKLAVAMVNANGGKTEALNGYAYLFVRSGSDLTALDALRKQMLEGTPEERAMVETLLQDATVSRGLSGAHSEALD